MKWSGVTLVVNVLWFIYGGSSVWGSGWWFSILLLWRRIDMAYFIVIVLMFLKVFLMVGIGILNLFSSDFH
jgi:hypothetical protein